MDSLARRVAMVLAVQLCLSCGEPSNGGGGGSESCTLYTWEPDSGDVSTFPTDEILVPDDESVTGVRVSITAESFPAFPSVGPFANILEEMNTLDGVGLQSDWVVSFSTGDALSFDESPVALGHGPVIDTDGVGLVVLNTETHAAHELWPVEVRVSASRNRLLVRPMRPLPENAPVALFVTKAVASATATGCVESTRGMRRLIANGRGQRGDAIVALQELGVIGDAEELIALHVVRTQTATRDAVRVAQRIEGLPHRLRDFECSTDSRFRSCEARLLVEDYRGEDGGISIPSTGDVVAQKTWDIRVSIRLPDDGGAGAPYPVMFVGHGLDDNGRSFANGMGRMVSDGMAVVAIDALLQGEHPSTGECSGGPVCVFGIDASTRPPTISGRRAAATLHQTTFDRLQVLRAILETRDLDGDEDTLEVDSMRVGYFGLSMGGMMATEFAALSRYVGVVVNLTGSGRLSSLIHAPEPGLGSTALALFFRTVSFDERDMGFSAFQAVVDTADPAIYGTHVFRNRLVGELPPDYVMLVAIGDEVVPNTASWALVRALGLPLIGTESRPVAGVESYDGELPAEANFSAEGQELVTAGFLQMDVNFDGTRASHATSVDPLSTATWQPFLQAHFGPRGRGVLVDPYIELDVPHGPPE